jgi:hypothetical protein
MQLNPGAGVIGQAAAFEVSGVISNKTIAEIEGFSCPALRKYGAAAFGGRVTFQSAVVNFTYCVPQGKSAAYAAWGNCRIADYISAVNINLTVDAGDCTTFLGLVSTKVAITDFRSGGIEIKSASVAGISSGASGITRYFRVVCLESIDAAKKSSQATAINDRIIACQLTVLKD